MASTGDKDKDLLSLYDDDDDLLDYGDSLDFDPNVDLSKVDTLDEFDFEADGLLDDLERELVADVQSTTITNGTSKDASEKKEVSAKEVSAKKDTSAKEEVAKGSSNTFSAENKDQPRSQKSTADDGNMSSTQDKSGHRDGNYNQQSPASHSPVSNNRGGFSGRGGYNQGHGNYTGGGRGSGGMSSGMGRGNFQGGPGMGHHPMMTNMGRGMGVGAMNMNPAMLQNMGMGMGMGMSMSMNMPMMNVPGMGMGRGQYPGGGYGNQAGGMFGQGQGMNAGSTSMSPRVPQGATGTTGRNIHINPNFQKNRPPGPPASGGGFDGTNTQAKQYPPQSYQNQQQQQFSGQGQGSSRNWDQNHNQGVTTGRNGRSGPQDTSDGDRNSKDYSSGSDSTRGPSNGQGQDRDHRSAGDSSYRARSDRDGRYSSDRHLNDASRYSNPVRGPSNNDRSLGSSSSRSRSPNGSGSTSISSRLGTKRPGENFDDSYKALKSSGDSTPRAENSRQRDNGTPDGGSVSFLRDKRANDQPQQSQSNTNATPKGHVKMENIPSGFTEDSLRKLAIGIPGVDRVLSVAKQGDRTVLLGFASIEEAKFFRRQINRTTIEGSLVTVTLVSA